MPRIFISYRRDDSQYVTDNIYEHMVKHFGADSVFLDVGSIPFGADFREYLHNQIDAHQVVLVIIGPSWQQIMEDRSTQANDFVRIEIENALKQGKLVIPVLVKEAKMPEFANLPETIQELQWKNSAQVRRHPDLAGDCDRLADSIKRFFEDRLSQEDALHEPAAISINQLLPSPFRWNEIPGGEVTLIPKEYRQSTKRDQQDDYVPNGGHTTFNIDQFAMAKYPITNAQYEVFVDAADGYCNPKWWEFSVHANNWRSQNEFPSDSTAFDADYPRTDVCWFEAVAFCLWLSHKTNNNIVLPSDQQWQRAAQGDDNRLYPWGNEFRKNRCNFVVRSLTPVTKYKKGCSVFGVMDLCGNAWEWTSTDYGTGSVAINVDVENRVTRGGCASIPYDHARNILYRGVRKPGYRSKGGGFRIALL